MATTDRSEESLTATTDSVTYNGTDESITDVTEAVHIEGLGDDSVTTRSTPIKIMLTSISAVGILANIMTAAVILCTPSMRRKNFNIFILHQTFVDCIACLNVFFLQFFDDITRISNSVAADIYCRVWVATSLMWITILASTYNLVSMSIERHQAVTKPLQYNEEEVKRRIPFIFILVWVLAFAVFSPDFIYSRIVDGECRANIDMPQKVYEALFFFWMFATTIIPSVVMVLCYTHMCYFLMKSANQFNYCQNGEPDKRQQHMKAAQKNVLQTGVLLVIVYVFCWTYLTIINFFIVYGILDNFSSMEWNVALSLVLLNCCINPFIYSIRYHEFQRALRRLRIGCNKRASDDNVNSVQMSIMSTDQRLCVKQLPYK